MVKTECLKVVEDLLDSGLPLSEYCIRIYRDNGNYQVHIHHKIGEDITHIDDMYNISDICNSVSTEWRIEQCKQKAVVGIKIIIP